MKFLQIDTHVHIYPEYNLELLYNAALENFARYSSHSQFNVICLTDRNGQNSFDLLQKSGLAITKIDRLLLKAGKPDLKSIYFFLGKQIVTKEKIEILGLGMEETIPDGLSAEEVIDKILLAQGLPVLPWGLGKWFFSRGKTVTKLLEKYPQLSLGDISQRIFYSHILNKFCERNLIFGTDPLPGKGPEVRVGGFFSEYVINDKNSGNDLDSSTIKNVLQGNLSKSKVAGRRDTLFEFFKKIKL